MSKQFRPNRVTELGIVFETGRPVAFPIVRNTAKAPYLGGRYGQDIEPAGMYLLHDTAPDHLVRGWVRGSAKFSSPLVLPVDGGRRTCPVPTEEPSGRR